MANDQIRNFVKQQLASGYTPEQIRQYMIQYGYNQNDVDSVINELTSNTSGASQETGLESYIKQQMSLGYKQDAISNFLTQRGYSADLINKAMSNISGGQKGISRNTAIILGIGLILIITFSLFLFALSDKGENVTTTIKKISTTTLDSPSRTTTTRKSTATTTTHSGSQRTTTTQRSVSTTRDTVSTTTTTSLIMKTSPETASVSQITGEIKSLASYDEDAAVNYCEKVTKETYKDVCYDTLARTASEKSYCEQIISTRKKDSCYVSFISNKDNPDYSACAFITSSSLKRSCDALKQSKEGVEADNTPKITGIPNVNMKQDTQKIIQLDNYVTKSDVKWTASGTKNIEISINDNGDAKIIPDVGYYGIETTTLKACIDTNCDSQEVKITIEKVGGFSLKDLPSISINTDGESEINLRDYVSVTDDITWTYTEIENIILNLEGDRLLINGANSWNGDASSQIQGCIGSDCDIKELKISVTEQSDFVFTDIDDVLMNRNEVSSNIQLVEYVDSANITFTSTPSEHLSITIDANSTRVNITPTTDWSGAEDIIFTACKDSFCLDQEVNVRVI